MLKLNRTKLFFKILFLFLYSAIVLCNEKGLDETYYVQISLEDSIVIKEDAEIIKTPENIIFVPIKTITELVGISQETQLKYRFNNLIVSFNCNDKDVRCINNEIFLDLNSWSSIFKINLVFDEKKLKLNIFPLVEMAYLKRYSDNEVKNFDDNVNNDDLVEDILTSRINDGFAFDQNINFTRGERYIFDTNIYGNLYNYDSKFIFKNNILEKFSLTKIRKKQFNFLGAKASKVQLFNVDAVPLGNLSETLNPWGLYLNNYKNGQNHIINNVIQYKKSKDWIGEIYRDDILLEKVSANENGEIIFKKLLNRIGQNKYHVRLYGPMGEFEEYQESYNLKDSFTNSDNINYEFFLGDADRKKLRVLKLNKLLTNYYALSATLLSQEEPSKSNYAFSLGSNLMFSKYNLDFTSSFNQNKYLLTLDASALYTFGEMNFKSEFSNGYIKLNQKENSGQKFKYDVNLFLNSFFNLKNRILYSNFGKSKNDAYFSVLSVYNIFRLSLSTEFTYKIYDRVNNIHQIFRYFNKNSTFQFDFKVNSLKSLEDVSGLWNFDFLDKYSFYVNSTYNFSDYQFVYNLGFNLLTKYFKYNIAANFNNNISYSMNIFYGLTQAGQKIMNISSRASENNSLLKIVAFEDCNYNGVFDGKDKELKNVNFKINEYEHFYLTNNEGYVLVDGLQAYSDISIRSDLNSVDDIFLFPLFISKKVFIRPGMLNTFFYPFQRFFSISVRNKKSKNYKLLNDKNELIDSGIIDNNNFVLERIKPNNYKMLIGTDDSMLEYKFIVKDQDIDLF